MRLSMVVNDGDPVVATIPGPGYLSAYLKMSDRPKENKNEVSVGLSGMETRETETVHSKWPSVKLNR